MNPRENFESASGLRPASAFVVIILVLVVVAARGVKMSLADEGRQPSAQKEVEFPQPYFEVLDQDGVPLGISIDRLKLVMSPNSMWQAHTPAYMAERISETLGRDVSAAELIERMLPDAVDGVIRVDREPLLLDREEAARVHEWVSSGQINGKGSGRRVRGLWVQPAEGEDQYTLHWSPQLMLSPEVRAEQGITKPQSWTRRIADSLRACLAPESLERPRSAEELDSERARIWRALMPSRFKVVCGDVSPSTALRLQDLFEREWVHPHHMDLKRHLKRAYPVRGALEGRIEARHAALTSEDPPFEVLGRWGTYDPEVAFRRACAELNLDPDQECNVRELEQLDRRTDELTHRPSALDGIELLCSETLSSPAWDFLERRDETHAFRTNKTARSPQRRYLKNVIPACEAPRVYTTLNASLQRELRRQLEGLMSEHEPALAMGIAIDLRQNEVLAVDAINAYGMSGFEPTMHVFTPGSTMKVVTMATALEMKRVHPSEAFNTFNGEFRAGGHLIREAEGAPVGWISASRALADSCNAVLAQIGMRIDDEDFRAHLIDLGYGARPGSGLGHERLGMVPRLPWKLNWTHASVSFGHEIGVTMWQHAGALAAVVRGGEWLPLRILRSVEQKGVEYGFEPFPALRVFSARTAEQVREMMELGALDGTGAQVACSDLEMGTKTGTAQKVSSEVCLHVELEHNARIHACSKACRAALKGVRTHKRSCYTSSMCAYGRLIGGTREVLVYVVVDEPRGKAKFGSQVAGEATVAVLKEALGYTYRGQRPSLVPNDGFLRSSACPVDPEGVLEQPWAEVEGM